MFEDTLNSFVAQETKNEVEIRFYGRGNTPVTWTDLENLMKKLKQYKQHRTEQSRTVYGVDKKTKRELRYTMYTNNKKDECMIKKSLRKTDNKDYNFRIAESAEIPIQMTRSYFEKHHTITFIRDKSRKSFTHPSGLWRIDLSVVSSSSQKTFEIELELLKGSPTAVKVGNKVMKTILQSLQGSEYIISNEFAYSQIQKYAALLKQGRPRFAGPLPYTISKEQFNSGVLSCGYSVTDKADGTRYLMYVDNLHHVCLIPRDNKSLHSKLIYMGIDKLLKRNSIFDGEYVDTTYYIFDCLVFNSKIVTEQNLTVRLKYCQLFANKYSSNNLALPPSSIKSASFKNSTLPPSSIKSASAKTFRSPTITSQTANYLKIKVKKFYFTDVYTNAARIWKEKSKLTYVLDGLIFTPIYEPYFNKNIYKWKDYDTFDFFIRKIKVTESEELWKLYIAGFDPKNGNYQHYEFKGIDGRGTFFYKLPGSHSFMRETLRVPFTLDTVKVPRKLGASFDNNSVVEFKYNTMWKPFKQRQDKTFANGIKATNDAWISVSNPITIQNMKAGVPMFCGRQFHNKIKDGLIEKYSRNKKVLDIGSGAGGDIQKYKKHRASTVIGIDIVDVQYPHDTRYMRFYKVPQNQADSYNITTIIKNDPVKKFDVINCHFAVHYFFKSNATLANFVSNLKSTLNKDGLVVLTCVDGFKLIQFMNGKRTFENSVVKISLPQAPTSQLTGNKVGILLKGTKYFNTTSNEYLIPTNLFINYMASNGFSLIEKQNFSHYCNLYKQQCNLMSDEEKAYSFLNCSLVFKYV